MIAGVSIVILIVGNLRFILPLWGISGSSGRPFDFFLNYAGVEVILFAIGMAYRSYFLKKEHDIAVAHMVETLKESQLEKDFINKELEIKVEQRTKQIQEMNALLNTHNIQLKSEISHAIEARVFRSVMNFKEFQQIFIDDHACYSYLAKVKWKDPKDARCSRCDYGTNTILSNFSRRCGKCGYVESVTNGTLFHRLKFPILKAFYITYRTSNSIKELPTIIDMAEEINLRPGTLGNFRQKVIQLLQSYSSKKKHKDGWTHLIEYSIAQAKA
jgi:ribosomal protein S27AE